LVCVVALARQARAGEADGEQLVHLLGYVASDYPRAVDGGKVVSEFELNEQLSLLDQAITLAVRRERRPDGGLALGLRRLRQTVLDKGDAADVAALAGDLAADVEAAFALDLRPRRPPDGARGRAIYHELCAPCHGEHGHADTEKAQGLDPRPARFVDPEVAEGLSPLRISLAVRFGVTGTAMVPMQFLGENDRWDVAFYVSGLRFTPRRLPRTPEIPLGELARRRDGDLLDELYAAGVGDRELLAMLAELRTMAPYAAPPRAPPSTGSLPQPRTAAETGLGRARQGLLDARLALRRHDRRTARQVLVAAQAGVEAAAIDLALRGAGARFDELSERWLVARARAVAAPRRDLERDFDLLARRLTAAQLALAGERAPPALRAAAALGARWFWALGLALAAAVAFGGPRLVPGFGAGVALALVAGASLAFLGMPLAGSSGGLAVAGASAVFGAVMLLAVVVGAASRRRIVSLEARDLAPGAALGLALDPASRVTSALVDGPSLAGAAALAAGLTAVASPLALAVALERGDSAGGGARGRTLRVAGALGFALALLALVGRGAWRLALADVVPAAAARWPGVPVLGIHPSLTACVVQGAFVGLALALISRARAR
jgi:high-affinity iron transporter